MKNINFTIEEVLKLYEQSEWGQGLHEGKFPYEISIEDYKNVCFLNDEREFYSAIKKDIYKYDFEGIKLKLNVMDENYSKILFDNTYSSKEFPELLNLLPDELRILNEKIEKQTLFNILDDALEFDELFEYLDEYSIENENPDAQFDIYFEDTNKVFIDTNSNYIEFDNYDFGEYYYKDVPEILTYKTVEYFNNKSPNENAEVYLAEKMSYFDFIRTHDLAVTDEDIDFSKLLGITNVNEIQKEKVESASLTLLDKIANENGIKYYIDDERVIFSNEEGDKIIEGYKNALDFIVSTVDAIKENNIISKNNIIDYIKNEAKTQGFYGEFLQNHLSNDTDVDLFVNIIENQAINSYDELDNFLSKNNFFRNKTKIELSEDAFSKLSKESWSTEEFNEAMNEFSKVDKKAEQRLG